MSDAEEHEREAAAVEGEEHEEGEEEEEDAATLTAPWTTERGGWSVLACIPRVARQRGFPMLGCTIRFDAAPRATLLTVRAFLAPDRKALDIYPYIAGCNRRGRLLVCASQGPDPEPPASDTFAAARLGLGANKAYFVYDLATGLASALPDPPVPVLDPANACLVDSPATEHDAVLELQPMLVGPTRAAVLWYGGSGRRWTLLTNLGYPPHPRPWGAHGTVFHDNRIWWVDLSYGLLYADPDALVEREELGFVALPEGCALPPGTPDLDRRRCVGVSVGKLRYVQIHDRELVGGDGGTQTQPVVSMWTLIKRNTWEWRHDTTTPFQQIWDDDGYRATKLRREVPAVALVHPNHRRVVYFFQQSRIVGVNLAVGRVVDWQYFAMLHPPLPYHSSRFVRAWELPHQVLAVHNSQKGVPWTSKTVKGSTQGSGPSNISVRK